MKQGKLDLVGLSPLIKHSDVLLPPLVGAVAASAEEGHKPDKSNYAKEGNGHG
jgi:hypothetical protein